MTILVGIRNQQVEWYPDITPFFVRRSLWLCIGGGGKSERGTVGNFCSRSFVRAERGWRYIEGCYIGGAVPGVACMSLITQCLNMTYTRIDSNCVCLSGHILQTKTQFTLSSKSRGWQHHAQKQKVCLVLCLTLGTMHPIYRTGVPLLLRVCFIYIYIYI